MPFLKNKINKNLKQAMYSKNKIEMAVLRMLLTSLQNKEISLRKGEKIELNDDQVIQVIKSEAKKRKDSIDAYKKGNRLELAKKEEEELKILKTYLPKQISEAEIEKIVIKTINSIEKNANFGQIMNKVMNKIQGSADGNIVSQVVNRVLKS